MKSYFCKDYLSHSLSCGRLMTPRKDRKSGKHGKSRPSGKSEDILFVISQKMCNFGAF